MRKMDGNAADYSRIEREIIATAPVGAAGLLNLPNELLEMIMAKLPCPDQVRMRRVCRKFDEMFPAFCPDPVVQYTTHHYFGRVRGGAGGLTKLRSIIKSVTFSTTRTLTIFQPPDCGYVINAATIRDLSVRCPSLKRLILKGAPDFAEWRYRSRLKLDAVREVPPAVELELHRVRLEEWSTRRLDGIFKGPFSNWTVHYLRTHLQQPGFFQPLPGEGNQAAQHPPNIPQANFPPFPILIAVDANDDDMILVDDFHQPAPAVPPVPGFMGLIGVNEDE